MKRTYICVIGFLLALGGALSATPAAAERLAVADLYGEPDVRVEAGATSLLLRSMLAGRGTSVVPWSALYAGGAVVSLRDADLVLASVDAEWLITGTLERVGSRLHTAVRLYDRGGVLRGEFRSNAPGGDVTALAADAARQLARPLGIEPRLYPAASLAALRPYVDARDALLRGDPNAAAEALSVTDGRLGGQVPAVRDLAAAVSHDARASVPARIHAAIAGGSTGEALTLSDAAWPTGTPDPTLVAARARAQLAGGDVDAAAQTVALAAVNHPEVALVRAELADRQGDRGRRDAELAPLIRARQPRALAFVARLPEGALPAALERDALDAAGARPELAPSLALRAARGGASPARTLASLQVAELSDDEVGAVNEWIEQLPPAATTRAGADYHRVRGELALRRGDVQAADDELAEGLAADPDNELLRVDYGRLKVDQEQYMEAVDYLTDVAIDGRVHPHEAARARRAGGDDAGARAALAAAPLDPSSAESLAAHAHARIESGDVDGGIALLEQASSLTPASPALAASLADAYTKGGYHERAVMTRQGVPRRRAAAMAEAPAPSEPSWGERLAHVGQVVGGVLALIVALLLFRWLLGRLPHGALTVTVESEALARNERFVLYLSRSPKRPVVRDRDAHAARLERGGHRQRNRTVSLPGPRTRFSHVSPGTWYVHLYGTYEREGQRHELGAEATRCVDIARNAVATVAFELAPNAADVHVCVMNDGAPVAGVPVWRGERGDNVATTDSVGYATLRLPLGQHVVRLEHQGLELARALTVTNARRRELRIDLGRERMAAKGITVNGGRAAAAAAASALAAGSGPQARGSENAPLADGSGLLALPGAHPAVLVAAGSQPGAALTAKRPSAGLAIAHLLGDGLAPMCFGNRYRATEELGRGGMGTVYRARDESLERDVALKVMGPALRRNPEALAMFLREAKAMAQLTHPNLVTVFDRGGDDHAAYLVMELVEGRSLQHLLEVNGELSLAMALELIQQLCTGLAYAHAKRVVHRDIKPANVFVTHDGRAKLGDFGLARAMDLTSPETKVRGTPLYMAPEQIQGDAVNEATDIYAVGCTIFACVAGRPPFVDGDVLFHQVHSPAPLLSELAPGAPPALDAIVARCLDKRPEARGSADELRAELARL